MQQHYSPRKISKAPSSAYTQPTPTTTSSTPSLETTRLQTELLQLSILHESLLRTSAQHHTSANAFLAEKFATVSHQHASMRHTQRTMQERLNLLALSEWTSGTSTFGLADNAQLLSAILRETPPLLDAGGRFPRLVDTFESWLARVEDIWAAREADSQEADFIDALGAEWAAENASLSRRLAALAREADMLLEARAGSSVATLVGAVKHLLHSSVEELGRMAAVERDVMRRERAWVQEELEKVDVDALLA